MSCPTVDSATQQPMDTDVPLISPRNTNMRETIKNVNSVEVPHMEKGVSILPMASIDTELETTNANGVVVRNLVSVVPNLHMEYTKNKRKLLNCMRESPLVFSPVVVHSDNHKRMWKNVYGVIWNNIYKQCDINVIQRIDTGNLDEHIVNTLAAELETKFK